MRGPFQFHVLFFVFGVLSYAFSEEKPSQNSDLATECSQTLSQFPQPLAEEKRALTCKEVSVLDSCKSVEGRSIFHFQKNTKEAQGLKILVFSLTHGDEPESTTLAMHWMNRMRELSSVRNHWRIVPVLNPDGFLLKTRMNKNGVDVNRNFPTKDWNPAALDRWKEKEKSDPRRFPGKEASSEPETKCAIKHVEDFQPDFVISLHTPYGLIDFDGPKFKVPSYVILPWKSLGHFPGSLGRYLWHERKTPVVTVELKNLNDFKDIKKIEELQDLLGTVAIKSRLQK